MSEPIQEVVSVGEGEGRIPRVTRQRVEYVGDRGLDLHVDLEECSRWWLAKGRRRVESARKVLSRGATPELRRADEERALAWYGACEGSRGALDRGPGPPPGPSSPMSVGRGSSSDPGTRAMRTCSTR